MFIKVCEVFFMSKNIIFMFSGQGSQFKGMGKNLYEENDIFRKHLESLDLLAQELTDESILEQLYSTDTEKQFERLLYTNSGIFMVEYALARTLIDYGIKPHGVIGSSMGEFAAAVISGVLSVDDAFKSLVQMSKLTETWCPPGGLLAIFDDPNLFHKRQELHQNSELASINFDAHFVVSGQMKDLERIKDFLRVQKITFQQVPVSYPFHSSYLNSMSNKYLSYLSTLSYNRPNIPFYSGVTGKQEMVINADYFWNVIRYPIQFLNVIHSTEQHSENLYIDLGPSGTLASFTNKIITSESNSNVFPILTPFQQDIKNLNKLIYFVTERKSEKMLAYLFPGQGAQKKGMGEALFDQFPELTAKADEILGYSIKQLCVEDPERKLGQTQYTQPALYVVHTLAYLQQVRKTNKVPDFVAGHSLGEYNALFASGAFDFETGLRLVKKRGELMSKVTGSGMAAIIGFSEAQIKQVLRDYQLHTIDIANLNTPSQIVIAGPIVDIKRAKSIFESVGVEIYIILRVSGAFHSRYMKEARKEFRDYLDKFDFNPLKIPVISNVTARPYDKETSPKELLAQQITSSVQWTDSVRYLMAQGEIDLVEIGDSNVLTKMVSKIKAEAQPLVLDEVATAVDEFVSNVEPSMKDVSQLVLSPSSLGDKTFKQTYNTKYAYVAGSMYKGIASKELVVKMGKAGMLSFYGTGGLRLERIEEDIQNIQSKLVNGEPYGMNLVHDTTDFTIEEKTIDLFIHYNIRHVEASAFMGITPALVIYRAKGLSRLADGSINIANTIMAKISRPDVAQAFLMPASDRLIEKLRQEGKITVEEAELLREVPMADDICAEADSGGHTDHGVAFALLPAIIQLRNEIMDQYVYPKRIRVGVAGGIGTPEAVASAFIMGADFVLTGSINQCTVEAGTSDEVKDLLSQMNVHDTESVPAGDMFEIGAKVQVLKKGVFFPARAKKLYELYRQFDSLDEIDEKTKKQLQTRYFKRSFKEIFEEVKSYHPMEEIAKAEKNPKHKMALLFRWYFGYSTRLAISGDTKLKVDYQIHTGPALGAFNQWVKGTELENWRNRHVDEIGLKLMQATVELLVERMKEMSIFEKVMG